MSWYASITFFLFLFSFFTFLISSTRAFTSLRDSCSSWYRRHTHSPLHPSTDPTSVIFCSCCSSDDMLSWRYCCECYSWRCTTVRQPFVVRWEKPSDSLHWWLNTVSTRRIEPLILLVYTALVKQPDGFHITNQFIIFLTIKYSIISWPSLNSFTKLGSSEWNSYTKTNY